MGPKSHPLDAAEGTDDFDFLLSGVPNLTAAQEHAPYLPNYHAESDVLEQVNAREAKRNAGVAATLVWWWANTRDPLPRQQTRPEVEKLLIRLQLVEHMKRFYLWEDWTEGKRGFPAAAP
jgi:hypothetical protein